jgi:mono/diheme cytochrome c family protein
MRLFLSVIIGYVLIGLSALSMIGCSLYHPPGQVTYQVTSPVSIAEGKRLTMLMCGSCHYNAATKDFSGKRIEDSPAVLGKVYAANLTRHTRYGIGTYTDAQLAYLIRTGVSRSGKIMPYMQRPNISDQDLSAIISFLNSDDESVRPSARVAGKTAYTPVGKLALSTVKPLPYENLPVDKPRGKGVILGKYLVDNLACFHCHSKSFAKLDISEPERSKGFMGGGNKLKDGQGKPVRTPNLTPHPTGILHWSLTDFKRALTQAVSKDGSVVTYPMPSYAELTDDEIASIYQYLQTLPPIDNQN